MNKREAKRAACWMLYQEVDVLIDMGVHLIYENDAKVEAALNELKAELLRRAGSAAVEEPEKA